LANGASIKATINAVLAKGEAGLKAVGNDDGKHDLFINLTLDIILVGRITSGDFKLITLP
jgi:hypothetical protein